MRSRTKIILGLIFIVLIILFLTVPSDTDYYKWLENEQSIKKSNKPYYYTQGKFELFDRSTTKRLFGVFSIREKKFEYINNGEISDNSFKIRTLEIGNNFFLMEKENILWRILR
ncbi:MAG: hypothetical protein ACTHW2_10230 [Tissierella sp.]